MSRMFVLCVSIALAGCASNDYAQYLTAQSEANRSSQDLQKPLVRLTAHPGMSITGLASLEVFAPQQLPVIQQARANEWAGVLGQGLSILGTVGSLYVGGKATLGVANAVAGAGTAGYRYIQAPAANVTTTTTAPVTTTTTTAPVSTTTSTIGANSGSNSGNSGRISAGSMTDATSTPTVVLVPTTPTP